MKIPIDWLREYVDLTGISEEEVSTALTMSGTENEIVKGVEFPNIVVGEIKEISKHPNADKLQVTKVLVSQKLKASNQKLEDEILTIICGAPNIEVGQKVPVALVGAMIGEFEIKEAEIRGVKSYGMLCSESELGISDDHTGIMILDARAKVGSNLGEALNIGGTVLEAEITPNRGDCLSMIGVAREAAAALDKKLIGKKFDKPEVKSKLKVLVEVKEKELCPRYIAKVVEGVKIGPSPKWMQEKLAAAGVRPINNVVDVTNYVMLEWGQPMHAFDLEKISGVNDKVQMSNNKKIIVRKTEEGERLVTLDGQERKLTKNDLVIADEKRAIALAGVMGGKNSEVDEKTTKVVLEAAVFNPVSVRKTAQRLTLRSEASNRFEKGIPLSLPEIAIERAASLLTEIPGGLAGEMPVKKPIAGGNTDVLSKVIYPKFVGIRISNLQKYLGIDVREEEIITILNSLGFEVEKFDFKKEARKHIGKPYVMGARYTTHGDMAFDCSYLTDFIYRKIGKFIGHTALGQFEIGKEIRGELLPGDIVFYQEKGLVDVTDHYYITDINGKKKKIEVNPPKEVGHCGIYIGNNRVIHAHMLSYDSKNKKWIKLPKSRAKVEEDLIDIFTKNPEYLGARRFVEGDDWIAITVPWWRLDVSIPEDIVEEVGRIYGYEKIPSSLPSGELPVFEENIMLKLISKTKNILSGAGFTEVYNYSFISKKQLESVGYDPQKTLAISNPISPEQEYMRPLLAPSLLFDAFVNQDNLEELGIFEVASIYKPTKKELPAETSMLGLAQKVASRDSEEAFLSLKGALVFVFKKLNIGLVKFKKVEIDYLAKGAAAEILAGKEKLGYLGLVSETTKEKFSLKHNLALAEINLETLLKIWNPIIAYEPISKYPVVSRDFTFEVDSVLTISEIEKAFMMAKIKYQKSFKVIDVYEKSGDPASPTSQGRLPVSEKSVTIRIVLGSREKTLTEKEITDSQNEVFILIKKLGGRIKTV